MSDVTLDATVCATFFALLFLRNDSPQMLMTYHLDNSSWVYFPATIRYIRQVVITA
ncbi:hypothetical protein [Grimontia hollisae]|uniref:hypothetical protein n=1 Tax=Grimontia hollisae TaxID=673 RepID=UPI000AC9BA81|nr:hypothetical protein [Grimontia hollisae]